MPPEVVVDRDEITIVGELRCRPSPPTRQRPSARRLVEGVIAGFREPTRDERIAIARDLETAAGREVAWGVSIDGERSLFTHLAVPVMTRLRQPERQVLDTLVAGGVARSRADALGVVRAAGRSARRRLAGRAHRGDGGRRGVKAAGPTVYALTACRRLPLRDTVGEAIGRECRVGVRDLAYTLYERRLLASLDPSQPPRTTSVSSSTATVGGPGLGYVGRAQGTGPAPTRSPQLLEWCDEAGVELVTLWLLSTDNLAAVRAELAPLLRDHREGRQRAGSAWTVAHQPGRRPRPAARSRPPRC